MDWMLMPLRRYADFHGRSRRKEYWMFVLGYVILFAVLTMLLFVGGVGFGGADGSGFGAVGTIVIIAMVLVGLGLFIPALAVQVRRFHDQDMSGWWVLLGFIPYVGALIVLVFMCIQGTRGPNRFGPDPKAEHLGDVFA